jgi:hypothetical protein
MTVKTLCNGASLKPFAPPDARGEIVICACLAANNREPGKNPGFHGSIH